MEAGTALRGRRFLARLIQRIKRELQGGIVFPRRVFRRFAVSHDAGQVEHLRKKGLIFFTPPNADFVVFRLVSFHFSACCRISRTCLT